MSLSEPNLIQSVKHYLNNNLSVDAISKKIGITYTYAVTLTNFAIEELKQEKKSNNTFSINQITELENEAYCLAEKIGSGNDSIKNRNSLSQMLSKLETIRY